jgi:Family of unknown function (DUF6125)
MSGYPAGSVEDREVLKRVGMEKLLDYFFLQIRNLWRVDGLYFLGIEKKFGTEAATEIDAGVWEAMAGIEAKALQKMFCVGEKPDVATIIGLLRKSSWAMDQPFKTVETGSRKAILRIDRCRTQETRVSKGLEEFPCKRVRFAYLRSFAKALNPDAKVECMVCPPDKHSKDSWCTWEFTV